MQDHLRQMMLFQALVERGSITAAAEQLQLSKSVLSQHLKQLETALGVQLLQRTTRRQNLTPAGQAFYQRCCDIQQQAQAAWQDAQQQQQQLSGSVRLTAPQALIEPIVQQVLAPLLQAHPQLQPQVIAADERLGIVDQQLDVAVRVGALADSSMKQRRIGQFRELLVASPAYLQQRPAVSESAASTHHYIANAWQGRLVQHQLWHQDHDTQLTLKFSPSRLANNLSTVVALATAGAGLAYLPEFVLAQQPQLQPALAGYFGKPVPVYALHAYQQPPARVAALLQQLQQLRL
ncbi:LysR family transcriptional regulator [uncultured Ferrimonas sp.]|uniref:LysR family transcriptional regulator n=1 Tax=uncultured Ferrimonas sp. TaxID=432640 RepID=UPI00261982EB|nr:LysR family transcriptional regulator [uncultured Ferrimonas sp.]